MFLAVFALKQNIPNDAILSLGGYKPHHFHHIRRSLKFSKKTVDRDEDFLLKCAVLLAIEISRTRKITWLGLILIPLQQKLGYELKK